MRQLDNIDLTYSDILFLLRFIFMFLKHKIFWLILRLHHHGWLLFFLAGNFILMFIRFCVALVESWCKGFLER